MESFFRKSKTHRCEDEALIRRLFAFIAREARDRGGFQSHATPLSFLVESWPADVCRGGRILGEK